MISTVASSEIRSPAVIGVEPQPHLLQVEDDVAHIFEDSRNAGELVKNAPDPNRGDGRPLK
jgi:hypothetical protein